MAKVLKFILVSALCCVPLCAQPSKLAVKDSIKNLEVLLQTADESEKSLLLLSLAKTYFQDQNQEKAFEYFLRAINSAAAHEVPISAEDARLYAEALSIYLDPHAQSTKDTASAILEKYESVAKEHPEYTQIGFLVGASYANAGRFSDFFDMFYRSYSAAPNHYLAYKTKAIIHIKLFERAGTSEAKDLERQKIIDELLKAMEIYPQDHTLYKMTIAFSPENQKEMVVHNALKKIVESNMMVPRMDIGFYVEEAVKTHQYHEAQQLLDQQREWYRYSRIINAAQEFLDQHKKRA